MIKNKKREYISWVSAEHLSVKEISDLNVIAAKLIDILKDYLNEHTNLKLVSYSFMHDSSGSYYDWAITAILEKV